jgi:pimeloyl-ACP methyl ester carboxylesterase
MPIVTKGQLHIDYIEEGSGETVVLIHSSVSGNRQWRSLIETLKDRYRVLALNLYGYGRTSSWSGDVPQTLEHQAGLVLALCSENSGPVHIVGHSFGGGVALKAASLLGSRVGKLIVYEPIPFYLLHQHDRHLEYSEVDVLSASVKKLGTSGEWSQAAELFADYWSGQGTWKSMPEQRQATFIAALPHSFHEWDAALYETTTIDDLKGIAARTLVMYSSQASDPIRGIVQILRNSCPHWTFTRISDGGHMAPLTNPGVVNPLVRQFLNTGMV